ncbi:helix-turn-helix domain-containing protein [Agrobacterium deltaense]
MDADRKAKKLARERARDAKRYREENPEPKGRNAIKTADPIIRELFLAAYRKGISRAEIARRVDRSETTVSYWKKNVRSLSTFDAVIFAHAVGCEIIVRDKTDGG